MLTSREIIERAYIVLWVYRLRAIAGRCCLYFFRLVFSRFTVGRRPKIWGGFRVTMYSGGRVSIGDDLHMVSSSRRAGITLFSPCSFTTLRDAEILIGDKVALNGTVITSKKRVTIGDGTMIAPNVIIVDTDFHALWPPDARHISSTAEADREVVIGKNVWIGMNCVVLKGTTIGDNSVIGAMSLVSGNIPANVIAAGNPIRVLRELGPPDHPSPDAIIHSFPS